MEALIRPPCRRIVDVTEVIGSDRVHEDEPCLLCGRHANSEKDLTPFREAIQRNVGPFVQRNASERSSAHSHGMLNHPACWIEDLHLLHHESAMIVLGTGGNSGHV